MTEVEREVDSPPYDSISSLAFSPSTSDDLLVGSWDTTCRYYDGASLEQRGKFDHRAAVLDCTFSESKKGYSASLDNGVRELDLATESIRPLGVHTDAVSQAVWSSATSCLYTGSWDKTVRIWDPKIGGGQAQTTLNVPERVYSMDGAGHILLVALAGRLVHIFDTRRMDKPVQERESSLKFLTRTIAAMPSGDGYAIASVEGRVGVEFLDTSTEAQARRYAFKCHRQTVNEEDLVWPVNALAFHPTYATFASGGSDGAVSVWDHAAKKRLRQYPRYGSAVNALAFSSEGTKLAVAVSYGWDKGAEGAKEASANNAKIGVFIKTVGDEVKPKAKVAKG